MVIKNLYSQGAGYLPQDERMSDIQKFCADVGYRGTFVSDAKEPLGLDVDISEKIKPHQWEKLPWR